MACFEGILLFTMLACRREVAARLHTATSVHLAMSSAMDTVGGMVHSLLQASKHPLKREAAPVPFEVVQLPVAL
eukprot:m.210410 g.210410  ORF g.210410 m.210410 type:complete len:74 (+) comp17143_c0_seq5:3412-3633(+)